MSGPYQIPGGVNVRSLKRNAAGLLGWDGTGWFYMDSGPEEELAAEVIRLRDERSRLREKVKAMRTPAPEQGYRQPFDAGREYALLQVLAELEDKP